MPDAETASYGEVNSEGKEPVITILAVTDGCLPQYHHYPNHPIKNDGLWQRLWETQATITVNNAYSQPGIEIPPIGNARSAIVIPLFVDQKLHGILSLCSSKENVFLADKRNVLEWLVQAFSSKLREINRNPGVLNNKASDESREVKAIQNLIDFFTGDKAESAAIKGTDELVKTAIEKIIPYTDCSWLGLYLKATTITIKYLPINVIIMTDRTAVNNLQFTPGRKNAAR